VDDIRLATLVVRSLRSLPDDERDAVLTELVSRGLSVSPPPQAAVGPLRSGEVSPHDITAWLPEPRLDFLRRFAAAPSGGRQAVPVRLEVRQHERLKQWCQANDMSMATVIRGLVERFLEHPATLPGSRAASRAGERRSDRDQVPPPVASDPRPRESATPSADAPPSAAAPRADDRGSEPAEDPPSAS
jgi:hypothetical protein